MAKLIRHDPPPGVIEVAKKRTREHLHNLQMVNFDLSALVVNCYLQGLIDAIDVCESRFDSIFPEKTDKIPPSVEYPYAADI